MVERGWDSSSAHTVVGQRAQASSAEIQMWFRRCASRARAPTVEQGCEIVGFDSAVVIEITRAARTRAPVVEERREIAGLNQPVAIKIARARIVRAHDGDRHEIVKRLVCCALGVDKESNGSVG